MMIIGYDCVHIPGAGMQGMTKTMRKGERICGRSVGLGTMSSSAASKTVCSQRQPFSVRFVSDQYEFENEAKKLDTGFRLMYTQDNMCN